MAQRNKPVGRNGEGGFGKRRGKVRRDKPRHDGEKHIQRKLAALSRRARTRDDFVDDEN